MRQIALAALLVIALVGQPVAAQPATNGSAYTPPAGYTIEDLVGIYNDNLEKTPWWVSTAVRPAQGDDLLIVIYDSATLEGDRVIYDFELDSNGRIVSYAQRDSDELQSQGYALVASEDTVDRVITADDSMAALNRAWQADEIQLRSRGAIQSVTVAAAKAVRMVRSLF